MELSRIVLGLLVAVLLPYDIPAVADKRSACLLVSWLYMLYALVGVDPLWKGAVLLGVGLVWSILLCLRRVPAKEGTSLVHVARDIARWLVSPGGLTVIAAAASLVAVALVYDRDAFLPFVRHLLDDNEAAIAISGMLLAVVLGQRPVTRASVGLSGAQLATPYEGVLGVDRLGLFLGWFERALIFIFIVSGQPSGAALALTAKSVARYPALERKEISGEYFLAGTFSSVLFAIFAGILTRLCLKMSAI
jgi:hypothetical protein